MGVVALLAAAGPVAAQVGAGGSQPFGVTHEDLLQVRLDVMRWTALDTYVGGISATLQYQRDDPTDGECRAAVLVGVARLHKRYTDERGSEPVTLRLGFSCGASYDGELRYDGVNTYLRVRDIESGDVVYEGRERGLASLH